MPPATLIGARMRRLAAALVLLAVSGASARAQAPYSVSWGDAVSVVAAGVAALIPEATKLPKAPPSCGSTAPCDPASLPGVDRVALHTFSGSAGTASSALLAGVIGFAGINALLAVPADPEKVWRATRVARCSRA